MRLLGAIWAALVGALLVAIPCAVVWGHSGPDWPLIPLVFVAAVAAFIGWHLGDQA